MVPANRTETTTTLALLLFFITTAVHAVQPPPSWSTAHNVAELRSAGGPNFTPEEIQAQDERRSCYVQHRAISWRRADVDDADVIVQPTGKALLRPGYIIGTANYIVTLSLGTPSNSLTWIIDTGSDLCWTQCQPCTNCYSQWDPLFNPAESSTYFAVDCGDSKKCNGYLGPFKAPCTGAGNPCLYRLSYADGSVTKGVFAADAVFFAGATAGPVQPFYFGCGSNSTGTMNGYSGILAISKDPLSFISQAQISVFAYCLPPPFSTSGTGFMEFNPAPSTYSSNSLCVDLIYPKQTGLYMLSFVGFALMYDKNSVKPKLPASSFQHMAAAGNPIVLILDSGTLISKFRTVDYVALRDAFLDATADVLTRAAAVGSFDTCFTYPSVLAALNAGRLPSVGIMVNGSATPYTVPPAGLFTGGHIAFRASRSGRPRDGPFWVTFKCRDDGSPLMSPDPNAACRSKAPAAIRILGGDD